MIVPAVTLYVVLVWFLWGFFMALSWQSAPGSPASFSLRGGRLANDPGPARGLRCSLVRSLGPAQRLIKVYRI
jgi:hypothetical protein